MSSITYGAGGVVSPATAALPMITCVGVSLRRCDISHASGQTSPSTGAIHTVGVEWVTGDIAAALVTVHGRLPETNVVPLAQSSASKRKINEPRPGTVPVRIST